jgi:E3 ubiquitin-protein ligase HECTD1
LEEGISQQLEAFKSGFSEVFPIEKLGMFTPEEVRAHMALILT